MWVISQKSMCLEDKVLKVGLLAQIVCAFVILIDIAKFPSMELCQLTVPPAVYESATFSTPLRPERVLSDSNIFDKWYSIIINKKFDKWEMLFQHNLNCILLIMNEVKCLFVFWDQKTKDSLLHFPFCELSVLCPQSYLIVFFLLFTVNNYKLIIYSYSLEGKLVHLF